MWITSSPTTAKRPTVIALGNFDGVHLGHREVIRPVLEVASQAQQALTPLPENSCPDGIDPSALDLTALTLFRGYSDRSFSFNANTDLASSSNQPYQGLPVSTVLTFFPHPQEYFSQTSKPLLTPIDEKALQLKEMGVDQLVLLPFNQELASLSPEQFVEYILVRHLKAQHISVGMDFRFGRSRAGTVEELQRLAAQWGIGVTLVALKQVGGERISSSRIRAALSNADLVTAAQLLGRPYGLTGRVVQGQQLGRTLGFPTANLKVPAEKFLPRSGVYSVRVLGVQGDARSGLPGVMNIGHRPTVDGTSQTIEVHLLQWSGDLYGQTLRVVLEHYLRPEQRFDSLDSLKHQIQADCEAALATVSLGPIA